jgi:sarcosine oxidase, subunit beta
MIPLRTDAVPATADAVVVGGGVIGLSTAYELARQGVRRVVVVEAGYLGAGATGRCGGGIRQQWTTEANVRLAQESVTIYEQLSAELGYQTFFRQGGYLMITEKEEDRAALRTAVELQNRCGAPTRFLEPRECLDIVPQLDISRVRGATFCHKDGTAYPFAVVWGYARAAHRRGVQIFIQTRATGFLADDGRVRGVVTDRGTISAPVVVLAADAWNKSLAAQLGVQLPNWQERHEIMVSESVKPCLGPMVISITNGIYFSQSMRGEFVGGIGDPDEPRVTEPSRFDTRSQLRFAVRFARALTEVFPPARPLRLLRQWAGLYDMTPDHRPILGGVPGLEGYYHVCGFSGHGFMLAPITARRLARHITTGRPDDIIDSLLLSRFAEGKVETDRFVVG